MLDKKYLGRAYVHQDTKGWLRKIKVCSNGPTSPGLVFLCDFFRKGGDSKLDMFSSPVMTFLQKGLDAGALRQRTTANNIANVNTPNFKKSTVAFESLLKKALEGDVHNLKATHPRHFSRAAQLQELQPLLHKDESTFMRTDGNNVDMDEEMTNLAANGIQYQLLGRELSERFSLLRHVITGGRG